MAACMFSRHIVAERVHGLLKTSEFLADAESLTKCQGSNNTGSGLSGVTVAPRPSRRALPFVVVYVLTQAVALLPKRALAGTCLWVGWISRDMEAAASYASPREGCRRQVRGACARFFTGSDDMEELIASFCAMRRRCSSTRGNESRTQ